MIKSIPGSLIVYLSMLIVGLIYFLTNYSLDIIPIEIKGGIIMIFLIWELCSLTYTISAFKGNHDILYKTTNYWDNSNWVVINQDIIEDRKLELSQFLVSRLGILSNLLFLLSLLTEYLNKYLTINLKNNE